MANENKNERWVFQTLGYDFPKHASSIRGSYLNMKENVLSRLLLDRVEPACLRQRSRKFGTVASSLCSQIAIVDKNVDTSNAKSMVW